ncbi:hypothetical protein A3Q56_02899 [Intoshia linei]|uniref:Uncharacterized protein n=1 Tax=Intoshia linei TaxID=1819745 RepID=A0A177B507_9BILA|nr:hypothetical protein A3Q56_02899 [Intoshia linei]
MNHFIDCSFEIYNKYINMYKSNSNNCIDESDDCEDEIVRKMSTLTNKSKWSRKRSVSDPTNINRTMEHNSLGLSNSFSGIDSSKIINTNSIYHFKSSKNIVITPDPYLDDSQDDKSSNPSIRTIHIAFSSYFDYYNTDEDSLYSDSTSMSDLTDSTKSINAYQISNRKVTFAPDDQLVDYREIDTQDPDYKQYVRCYWEHYAVDAWRFKTRVKKFEDQFHQFFTKEHRDNHYTKYLKDPE